MNQPRALAASLVGLAGGLAVIAVLGPLVSGVIRYRSSTSMLNQAIGLDAFALAVVAPVALLAARLSLRRHAVAPLLALAPAGFAAYMTSQYVIGPEYLLIEGNGERAFLLFVAVFVLACLVLAQAWSAAVAPSWTPRVMRRRGALVLLLAVFVVLGMYVANGFVSAMADFPQYVAERAAGSEYEEHPTAYWLVAFLDLAVVVPLTVATGIALLRGREWARVAYYGVIGWFALVPGSVAAMAITMVAREDPAGDAARAVALSAAALVFSCLSVSSFVRLARELAAAPAVAGQPHEQPRVPAGV